MLGHIHLTTHTHTAMQADCEEAWCNIYCTQPGYCIVSVESHYFHAVSEAIIRWGNATSLLGGFICSRVMAISQCVAMSKESAPPWCAFGGVCKSECGCAECIGNIISHFTDEKPMLKVLLGLQVSA